ncbi:polyprenyl synthetase family protein [Kitasatospora sp. NPDC059973]|uniref:polyprenyl synthetase family protein n=1 Tax=Kitasatospora sp. NPDC059973 TaxID=3347020 RepID=UPI0036894B3B
MTVSQASTAALTLDLPGIRQDVDAVLEEFLRHKVTAAVDSRLPDEVPRALGDFVFASGKRLRPLLCVIGWHTAQDYDAPATVIRAAAALEMFHTFALIHDDLMDRSDTRRGRPTVHRALADRHRASGAPGDSDRVGTGAAILVGDLALAWSDELLHTARLSPSRLAAVLPVIDTMRTELMYGQYLDLVTAGQFTADVGAALRVVRLKTAKYTCERPLHIGALLGGAGPAVLAACTAFATPLGEAFQLRDDLLGAFGSVGRTGKSASDDFRGGKQTVLVALALQRADASQRRMLQKLIGNPDLDDDGAADVREILTATGARQEVEQMIRVRFEQALQALDKAPFTPSATAALRKLAHTTTDRTT